LTARSGPTSYIVRRTVSELSRTGSRAWRAVAEALEKPSRRRVAVNLSRINRVAGEGEMIVVPGKVLGAGRIEKRLTIAALAFSMGALRKIREAGGEAITLMEAAKRNPSGSRVRIVG